MEIVGYIASVLIGISLGLIGSGGSILTVPILVYLFLVPAESATSYSLFIVGITALLGALRHYQLGNLQLRSALYFAVPSTFSLLLVRKVVLPLVPQSFVLPGSFELSKNMLLMLVFALLMIAASVSMIRTAAERQPAKGRINFFRLALVGLLVGLVTGFLGAGGGFLIIPALMFFAGLRMKQAVGTSLLIIFINSSIGFTGDLFNGIRPDPLLLLSIALIAIIGMLIGTQLSRRIAGEQLKPLFGWFVLVMGIYIIAKEILFR